MFMWSGFDVVPTVAMHPTGTRRISPEGSLSVANLPSRAVSCAYVPAERAICAPFPGFISMAWTCVPSGMFDSGRQLPGSGAASGPETIVWPTASLSGAMMYRFSPSA